MMNVTVCIDFEDQVFSLPSENATRELLCSILSWELIQAAVMLPVLGVDLVCCEAAGKGGEGVRRIVEVSGISNSERGSPGSS